MSNYKLKNFRGIYIYIILFIYAIYIYFDKIEISYALNSKVRQESSTVTNVRYLKQVSAQGIFMINYSRKGFNNLNYVFIFIYR